ncbi:AlkA N-terminal domain-containing protein [Lacibacterium aquatile]|uniref:DNA-3-methyladenine glycosylase II n=1 Tax=Lacibacterium aquatile TaxID=1168082 RepID=A0ABW5DZE2_9PROT
MENLDPDICYRALATRDARFDGRIFVAVRSTGIYCRPICPARTAKRENVTFYASAAAAQEAGFRPCLRCRPETSPDMGAWRGSSNTVSRALALIEEGAMDEGDVEALGDRLGVGGRQLRRLFKQHLGASPVAVAQTRRVLLAKQLIHETRLSMAEVALAAGFGSVRRFNETFQTLFRRAPASLRHGAQAIEIADAPVTLTLGYRAPYDWAGMLGFLASRAILGVEAVIDGRYARTIALGGKTGHLLVEPGKGDSLKVTIRFPDLTQLPQIIARVRRVFDLSADPLAISSHLAEDPTLAPLVARRPGLRAPGAWDSFELAVRAILGQQITVPVASRLAGTLAATFGGTLSDPAALALGLTHVFPDAAALAKADIAGLGLMPGARAKALTGLAAAVATDPRLLCPYGDLDSAVAKLCALPGIGDWTAQYIALRALRESDAFPAADVGLLKAMAVAGIRPSVPELLDRAETWRPWRAYAAIHLWASLSDASEVKHAA